ncbi:MAG: aldehyde ferredoxin oxidoreductase C-terminal domain-containing protein [Candidatus Bathyarchaeia archaeon]
MRGYTGKLLEVDLSSGKIRDITLQEEMLRQFIGGRGLATKILWDKLGDRWEDIDPLGPENVLLILSGPLTGYFPGGRICLSGKSPQSCGVVGSTIGGEFGIELKCSGYDGIIITGVAERPSYLFITNNHVDIKDASNIRGMNGRKTLEYLMKVGVEELKKLNARFGEIRPPAILYIGPAGERKSRMAAVMSKWSHAAGYGGYGAVMGSKNLKAILVKGFDPLPEVFDMKSVMTLREQILKIHYRRDDWRRWGTAYLLYECTKRLSSAPIKNWQEEWCDEARIGITHFEKRWIKRYWADFGCPLACMKVSKVGDLEKEIITSDGPDYELQAYLGSNLGVFEADAIIRLSSLVDDLGFCGIQVGNLLGFITELFEQGIITKEDLGMEIKWGDVKAYEELLRKIAQREGIGDILAEGTYRAAKKISKIKGMDLLQYAVTVKGIAVGAHGIRSGLDYVSEIGYALSTQGGDHGSTARLPPSLTEIELFSDSAVFCVFLSMEVPENLLWDFFYAVTGWDVSPEEWSNILARRILHMQRAMLLLGGPDVFWDPRIHDNNPRKFYEPLPSGPYQGKKVDEGSFNSARKKYYQEIGWDELGIPSTDELKKLGLEDVDERLRIVRRRIAESQ